MTGGMTKLPLVLAIVILSANAYAKSPKKGTHRSKATVTTVDLGSPAEAESPWPAITKKGHL
jgi:hypothetical protein